MLSLRARLDPERHSMGCVKFTFHILVAFSTIGKNDR